MTFKRSNANGAAQDFGQVTLPEGVSEEQWRREMEGSQNPRLRTLLGCLRRISGALESNIAILHSSPLRLAAIWAIVREVAERIGTDLAPLLARTSVVPDLEAARLAVSANLAHLELTLLAQIDDLPAEPPPGDHEQLRRFLCVAVGNLHGFLQDSFGSLMASDPRGCHDADYYLSKEFPRDVEESEWLYTSVIALDAEFKTIEAERRRLFPPFLEKVAGRQRIPDPGDWAPMDAFLRFLSSEFTDRLKKILSLRAIRLTELDLLSHHASEMPVNCRLLLELYEAGRQVMLALSFGTGHASESMPQAAVVSTTISSRLIPHVRGLDDSLRDLGAFIPLWRQGISQRRALAFRSSPHTARSSSRLS